MNILNKLSTRNLKLNKKRTISTIIAIILSIALICAVASMGLSFQATLIENAKNETGYWHIKLKDIEDSQIKNIENNRDIKEIHSVKKCGYSELKDSKDKDKTYVKLFSMNNNTFNHLNLKLKTGRFPNNNEEVIINEGIIDKAKVDYKIGDIITLNIGELNISYESDSYSEEIIDTKNYEFKIVGIIEKPDRSFESSYDPGYTIISTNLEQGYSDIYVSLKNPKEYEKSISELLGVSGYNEVEEHNIDITKYDYDVNRELLRWEAFAFSDSTVSMLYGIIGIVITIIIFTSVFCIRNSFAIATTERIKMYSMLASVGTTKKQIRKNVIEEGLILGVIGIPAGIILGFLAVFVLIGIVNLLLGEALLEHVDGLVFKISIIPIIISFVLGIITIYLSSRSSAKKASKVSPIEGLRNSNDIKLKNKKLKVPKIIAKTFKIGGTLAYKNLKRNKKKYRTTVISITISIFIFITMNAFITNAFGLTANYYTDYNYNLQISARNLEKEDLEKIKAQNNIESYTVLYYTTSHQYLKIYDLSKINEDVFYKYSVVDDDNCSAAQIVALDSVSFEKYIKEIGVKYNEVKGKGILCDEYYTHDNNKETFIRIYTYSKGDKIIGQYEENTLEIAIGEVSKIKPDGIKNSYYPGGYLIVELDEYSNLDFSPYIMTIQSNNVNQLEKDLKEMDNSLILRNLEEEVKEQKSMILVVKIFLYGFIAVITLIGVTNIFNTITSNMELRQKEFAMLKSIGMTKKEFNRMINLETIFYGTKSWIYGTIAGLIGTFAIYKVFSVKIDKGVYIPIDAILISAVFVLIFVFIIMKYSIKKINSQNTIETIRKDNI